MTWSQWGGGVMTWSQGEGGCCDPGGRGGVVTWSGGKVL